MHDNTLKLSTKISPVEEVSAIGEEDVSSIVLDKFSVLDDTLRPNNESRDYKLSSEIGKRSIEYSMFEDDGEIKKNVHN